MSDLEVCAAALFLSRGKDVVTRNEFSMTVSMDLRWMPKKEADGLLKVLVKEGVVTLKDDYVRPAFDMTSVKVPVSYKPMDDVRALAKEAADAQSTPQTAAPAPKDTFSLMKSMAASAGIDGKEYMSRCRAISKSLGITQTAAGLVVLNEAGIDVSKVIDSVEKDISVE